jgi:hypothetical protein
MMLEQWDWLLYGKKFEKFNYTKGTTKPPGVPFS